MTRVVINEDCGNSPKNIFLEKLTVAFATGDLKYILSNVTDDIRWNIVGDSVLQGKDSFARALQEINKDQVVELTIRHIATHGKTGAIDGNLEFKNGNIRAFCNVYEFSNTKGTSVKEITSYFIEIK